MQRLLQVVHADPYSNLLRVDVRRRYGKLLSPAYIASKIQLVRYENAHPDAPWLTRDAINLVEGYLRPEYHVFEFGSGKSTLWLAQRVAHVTAVEHNQRWYDLVSRQLAEHQISNVTHVFVDEDHYVDSIDKHADASLDLVLVDGLYRDRAFLRAIQKVREGGWIVFDNANWYLPSASKTPLSRSLAEGPSTDLFGKALQEVRGWRTFWTSNGVNDTATFVKPRSTPR